AVPFSLLGIIASFVVDIFSHCLFASPIAFLRSYPAPFRFFSRDAFMLMTSTFVPVLPTHFGVVRRPADHNFARLNLRFSLA
ncbi:MAG: hypothetical protein M3R15_28200, partial [Acidobacteriota bacterium]|nr:hypothetical protein [Acidobacteriota bacterium]